MLRYDASINKPGNPNSNNCLSKNPSVCLAQTLAWDIYYRSRFPHVPVDKIIGNFSMQSMDEKKGATKCL
jgi:hypothetical protein